MVQFFQTVMGQRFIEGTVPQTNKALNKIANELAEQNRLKRIELGLESAEKENKVLGEGH